MKVLKNVALSPLEKQVIALIVAGYSSEESAKRLSISAAAFRAHLTNICKRFRVSNQFEMILYALYHHLVGTP